ncbi:hypothetical protein V8C37DRAFT_150171 [Trichoderma ceciliae]
MCEQIIKYDCGHLCRRKVPGVKPQPKRHHSVTCFSVKSASREDRYHEAAKLERRATLCRTCEAQGKDRETYVNSTRQVSTPSIRAKQHQNPSDANEKRAATQVSASLRRSNSNPGQLPSQRLRRVRDTGNSSLRNEYARLESPLDNGFEAHRGQRLRPRDIAMPGSELDWYASGYVPLCERTPLSATSFAGLLDHGQSRRDSPRLPPPACGLSRSDSIVRRLQKSLHIQKKPSDESFVCSSSREVERGER